MIRNIWLWISYYPYLGLNMIVCAIGLQDTIIDLIKDSVGGEYFDAIDTTAAKASMKATADARCEAAFTKVYEAYNYSKGNKVLWDQNFDSFNYTPGS